MLMPEHHFTAVRSAQLEIDKTISKLHQPQQQEEAVEEISIFLNNLPTTDTLTMESTVLQLADVFNNSTNKLRSLIASLVFCRCNEKIQQMLPLSSKEIFL